MIPLLSLEKANAPHLKAIEAAMLRVARSGRYILGPELEKFEAEWAKYCGVKYCIGTGNAMEALQLILMGLGIDGSYPAEVIVASNSYIATFLAVTHAGATPVPCEPDVRSFNIDPAKVEACITNQTRAILVTHLYGRCADMARLQAIADAHGIYLIADAAQAHGSRYKGRVAGSLCHAEAFSFYPSKNLGGMGDAGCITTDDENLAEKCRRMRNYGGVGRVDHQVIGINSRMDEMQAAILSAKLEWFSESEISRFMRAECYNRHFESHAHIIPPIFSPDDNYHQYVIRSKRRDHLQQALAVLGIDTHIHYPVPPHLEGAYAGIWKQGDFPIAEMLANDVLSLPIGYNFDVDYVARTVSEVATQLAIGG